MNHFLNAESVSLKVCGVTTATDAEHLVKLGVEAVGINFWPKSKRYCAPERAEFLKGLAGKIVRVGVFVNADPSLPMRLLEQGYLDYVQFHGDEDAAYIKPFADANLPFIRAVGVKDESSIAEWEVEGAAAILLDAHAPGVYGGTGQTCDWGIIGKVKQAYPNLPIVLAGGITTENVKAARELADIVALDVASGAESSPGVKDFQKVKALM